MPATPDQMVHVPTHNLDAPSQASTITNASSISTDTGAGHNTANTSAVLTSSNPESTPASMSLSANVETVPLDPAAVSSSSMRIVHADTSNSNAALTVPVNASSFNLQIQHSAEQQQVQAYDNGSSNSNVQFVSSAANDNVDNNPNAIAAVDPREESASVSFVLGFGVLIVRVFRLGLVSDKPEPDQSTWLSESALLTALVNWKIEASLRRVLFCCVFSAVSFSQRELGVAPTDYLTVSRCCAVLLTMALYWADAEQCLDRSRHWHCERRIRASHVHAQGPSQSSPPCANSKCASRVSLFPDCRKRLSRLVPMKASQRK